MPRQRFLLAHQALAAKDAAAYRTLVNSIADYPLLPYLKYADLQTRLSSTGTQEVREFLQRYADSPLAASLRTQWLRVVIARNDWQVFLEDYQTQRTTDLRCREIEARQRLGVTEGLIDAALKLWQELKELPQVCEPVLALLDSHGALTEERVWTQFKHLIQRNRLTRAQGLIARLGAEHQGDAAHWLKATKKPAEILKDSRRRSDNSEARELLGYAMERLAEKDALAAESSWQNLSRTLRFTAEETGRIQRAIALAAASGHDPAKAKLMVSLLDRLRPQADDTEIHEARLRVALKAQDWSALKRWTEQYRDPPAKDAPRWRYWRARSLEQTGQAPAAIDIFRSLATQPDYYGLIAADRLGAPYPLHKSPVDLSRTDEAALLAKPTIQRAYELYRLGLLVEARREWDAVTTGLDTASAEHYAALAARWGWHDRAIMTTNRAHILADLDMRFPLALRPRIEAVAVNNGLETAMILGFVRTESAFMADAHSGAGALGLMQLMPATGRELAQALGTPITATEELLDIDRNLSFGTVYVRKLLDTFGGNIALAAAAYNAGPGRVKKWAPDSACQALDAWVELVPLDETREYVKRILLATTVYTWRLGENIRPIKERVAGVFAPAAPTNAAAACEAGSTSKSET